MQNQQQSSKLSAATVSPAGLCSLESTMEANRRLFTVDLELPCRLGLEQQLIGKENKPL